MGRMYSRKKGKAGSKKPLVKEKKIWVQQKPKELIMLIKKLHKEGKKPSEIGLVLRDSYAIPSVKDIMGKSINQILKEEGISMKIPEDLISLIERAIQIRKHIDENHKDQTAKRGIMLTESKIRRLVKYYKKTKVLPEEWKYDPEKAAMLLQ